LTQLAQWLRSDDGRVWLVSASANLMAGRTQEALDHLQKVLRIYPNHPGSHLLLTWVYITSRSLDEALPAAQRAIEANPTFAESHGTLAVIHALRGERDAAEKNIRRATLLDKNSFAARYAQSILEGNPPGRVDELFREVMRSFGR
jgi:tetratricopeptide (TPR) repeat protein